MKNRLGMGFVPVLGASPAPPWSPLNITSATLYSWHDAISSPIDSAAASNLGLVEDIAGYVGGPFHATQATAANKGSYNATGLNGKPCFSLIGNDVLDIDNAHAALFSGTDVPFTIWMVCRVANTSAAVNCLLHGFGNTVPNPFHYFSAGDGSSVTWISERRDNAGGASLDTRKGGTFSNGTLMVIEHRFTGTQIELNVNGVNQSLTPTDMGSGAAMTVTRSTIHGVRGIGSPLLTTAADLHLGALLTTSGNESAPDRAAMLAYLSARWA